MNKAQLKNRKKGEQPKYKTKIDWSPDGDVLNLGNLFLSLYILFIIIYLIKI